MLKKTVKQTALKMAAGGGLFTLCRWLNRRRVRILAYHGVSSTIDPVLNFDGFFVSPHVFEAHLRTLKGHYHVMPLSNIAEALIEGRDVPDHAVALTFDDGYLNNIMEAAPLLAKYEIPATFFVTTGFLDGTHEPWWWRVREAGRRRSEYVCWCVTMERELKGMSSLDRDKRLRQMELSDSTNASGASSVDFMSWSDLRSLAAQGHEIGAHTVSHISLGHESMDTLETEVRESLSRVRDEMGSVSPVYSYPYGERAHFISALEEVLKRHGCMAGVTTVNGMNRVEANPYFLKRLNVTGNHDRNAFRALVSGTSIEGAP